MTFSNLSRRFRQKDSSSDWCPDLRVWGTVLCVVRSMVRACQTGVIINEAELWACLLDGGADDGDKVRKGHAFHAHAVATPASSADDSVSSAASSSSSCLSAEQAESDGDDGAELEYSFDSAPRTPATTGCHSVREWLKEPFAAAGCPSAPELFDASTGEVHDDEALLRHLMGEHSVASNEEGSMGRSRDAADFPSCHTPNVSETCPSPPSSWVSRQDETLLCKKVARSFNSWVIENYGEADMESEAESEWGSSCADDSTSSVTGAPSTVGSPNGSWRSFSSSQSEVHADLIDMVLACALCCTPTLMCVVLNTREHMPARIHQLLARTWLPLALGLWAQWNSGARLTRVRAP